MSTQLTLVLCLISTVALTVGSNQHVGFTFVLPAGSTECFYQTTGRNDNMEVEYQVITPRLCLSFFLACLSGQGEQNVLISLGASI